MKLSEHFTLESMLRSQEATRLGFKEQFKPTGLIVDNLEALCVMVLEPLRQQVGKPVFVSSGYRCTRTNKAVGGSETSQHPLGQAADIEIEGFTNAEIISAVRKLNLPVDQCIEEFGQWVHVSYGPRMRREFLQAKKVKGKTIYSPL